MSIKITTESFKKDIYDQYGDEYTLLSEYEATCIKVKMKHNICGHVYKVTPNKFRTGRKCPLCANKIRADKRQKTKTTLQKELNEYYGKEEYTILSNEIGKNKDIIKVRHNREYCGYNEFETTPNYLTQGKGCHVCGGAHNIISFKHDFYNKFGKDNFEILDTEYPGYHENLSIKCNKCGYINHKKPSWLMLEKITTCLCKSCDSNSLSERIIQDYLIENNIKYETEVKFEGLKYKMSLRFDFKIYTKDSFILLEYDGIQHFKPVDYWRGEEGLEERKIKDNIKNSFCEENNIDLYRISYEDNIIEKLKEILDSSL